MKIQADLIISDALEEDMDIIVYGNYIRAEPDVGCHAGFEDIYATHNGKVIELSKRQEEMAEEALMASYYG